MDTAGLRSSAARENESDRERERLISQASTENRLEDEEVGYSGLDRFWSLRATCVLLMLVLGASLGLTSIGHQQRGIVSKLKKVAAQAPTVLISIDGFRHDYLEKKWTKGKQRGQYIAKTLRYLASTGATTTMGMQPVFPSKTFPNHWSMVVGLYPESSGIVGNTMYDVKRKRWFHHSTNEPEWWHGEPIWKTLGRSVKNIGTDNSTYTTATCFWPGSEVPGKQPDVFLKYDDDMPYDSRINTVVSFLDGTFKALNGVKADFVTAYFHGVDHAGHEHGPESHEVDKEIQRVDRAIEQLLQKLGTDHALRYNIVIVSDHGMAEVDVGRTVHLTVPKGKAQDIVITPLAQLIPVGMNTTDLLLKKWLEQDVSRQGHAKVYLKSELPNRWHLKHGEHVAPVLGLVDVEWRFDYPHQQLVPGSQWASRVACSTGQEHGCFHGHKPRNHPVRGDHGYDNTVVQMRSVFIAQGPGFRNNSSVKEIQAIDVYPTLCALFGVQPSPNNGSTLVTSQLLAG